MKKTIIALVIIALAGIALYKFMGKFLPFSMFKAVEKTAPELLTTEFIETSSSTPIISSIATSTANQTSVDLAKVEKDKAWAVLQKYLTFAKNHDIDDLASVSYQISDSCKSKTDTKDCEMKMDNVYKIGKEFDKKSFYGTWYDKKQIILFTDWAYMYSDFANGITRSVIYFIKDASGNMKLVYFNPSKGYFIPSTASSTKDEVNGTLDAKVKDTDRDGLSDADENCENTKDTCKKTDPNKRDTDDNGYWDGIQILFY